MEAFSKISNRDLRELLTKGWMTHDAMWLYHCLQECGIEKTNAINTAAVESMALIEIRRLKRALGVTDDKVENFDDLVSLVQGAFDLISADFMKFRLSAPSKNVLHWEWEKNKCFAYEGVKKLGIVDQYQCGIMVRIEGWFKGLGVEYSIRPEIKGCLMHTTGTCSGQYIFNFE